MKKFFKIVFIAVACCLTFASVLTLAACKCEHKYENGKCVKCGEWLTTEGVEYVFTDDGTFKIRDQLGKPITDRDRVGSSDHGSRPEPDPERIFCTSSDDAAVWNDDHDSGKDDRRNSKRKYRCQIYVIM